MGDQRASLHPRMSPHRLCDSSFHNTIDGFDAVHSSLKAILIWCSGSCLLVLILSLVFAHLPQEFKRLGLSYAVFGIVCGWGMGWIAQERKLTVTRLLIMLSVVIVLAGGCYVGWTGAQQFRQVRGEQLRQDPKQLAMLKMLENIAKETGSEDHEKMRRKLEPEFSDYLAFRVSGLGKWAAPWPLIFWGGEVCLAAVLAGFSLRQSTGQKRSSETAETTYDSEAI